MTRQIIFPSEVAEITLSYYGQLSKHSPTILCSSDAAETFRCRWEQGPHWLCRRIQSHAAQPGQPGAGHCQPISQGGIAGTVADPKLIFAAALKAAAPASSWRIIIQVVTSLPARRISNLTNKLKEAGKFLDLPVLDHVILTQDSYYSFADEGLL